MTQQDPNDEEDTMDQQNSDAECWVGSYPLQNLEGVTCEEAQAVATYLSPIGSVDSPAEVPGLGTWEVFLTDGPTWTYFRTDEKAGFLLYNIP